MEQEGLNPLPQNTHEKKKDKKKGKVVEEGERKNEVNDLANMMKDVKIYQLEAQKRIDDQLAEIKKWSITGEKKGGLSLKVAPYVSPNQYGNRQWPQLPDLRGCYWDGGAHSRAFCEDMLRAIEREDIHKRGSSIYLGRKHSGLNIRVPFPVEKDGEIVWQKEWVQIELAKKESEAKVNSITLKQSKKAQRQAERHARTIASQEAPEDQDEDEEIEYINGYPVIITKVEVD